MSARGYFAERARLSGEGRACPRDMSCQRPINHKGKCDASDPPVTARKPSAAPVLYRGDRVDHIERADRRSYCGRSLAHMDLADRGGIDGRCCRKCRALWSATPAGREAARRVR